MPDKKEVERRKQIAREKKFESRQEFEKSLPMSSENFKSLFDYLDKQLTKNGCDHNFKFSLNYLQSLELNNIDNIIKWLGENGGYCDCEILANVEDKFDNDAIL